MSYQFDLLKKDFISIETLKPSFENATLRLELSNICNHKCLCCPNSKIKRKRCHLEESLIYRLLKEAAELGVHSVGLFINGEPFISKNLKDYIKYAKDIGIDYVFITTNGALATKEKLKEVIDAGVDSIKFSINAGSRENYTIVHGKDDYEKVMDHLKFAYQYKLQHQLNVKILSSFVVTKYTKDEIDQHYEVIKDLVDDIVFFNAESFGGQMEQEITDLHIDIDNSKVSSYKIPNKLPCAEIFNTICITAEGYLTLCCSEAFNYLVVEDLNSLTLKDAWYSQKMQDIRKKHIENKVDGVLCYNCIFGGNKEYKPINLELFNKSYLP